MEDFLGLEDAVDSQDVCGPDCEYDGEFLALVQLAKGKPEQQFGDTVIAAEDPDWRAVEAQAKKLLGRTKDLRVAVLLTTAATALHGLPGYAAGLHLVHQLCVRYWDEVHPRLVIDGDDDPYLRINALGELSGGGGGFGDASAIVRLLRASSLGGRGMALSFRDAEQAAVADAGAKFSDSQVISVMADGLANGSPALAALPKALESFEAIRALADDKLGSEAPDFSNALRMLKAVNGLAQRADPSAANAAAPEGAGDPTDMGPVGSGSGAPRAVVTVPGEIRSREDVRRALQRVCEYLERHEPSNPASLFVRRAERMLEMSFMDIIRELSPDSVNQLENLTGSRRPDDSY